MIFGLGKSRKKEAPSDNSREMSPAFVCVHVLEGMKEDAKVKFTLSRDDDGDVTAMCEACNTTSFDPANMKIVGEGQALSYAKRHGVRV